jgi:hypothetical protein
MSKKKSKKTTTISLADKSVDLSVGSSFFDFFYNSLIKGNFNIRYFSFFGYKKLIYFYKAFIPNTLNSLKLISIPKSSGKKRLVYVNSLYDRLYAHRLLETLPKVQSEYVYGIDGKPFYQISKKLNSFYKSNKYKFLIGDFKNFSDSIPKEVLRKLIEESEIFDEQMKYHLKYFLNKSVFDGESLHTQINGMHTGTPLTNYVLNYFLYEFDNFLAHQATFYMRVGDDFVCVLKKEQSDVLVQKFIKKFQEENKLEICFDILDDDFEFLAYKYTQNTISVRDSSVKKFLSRVSAKLQVLDADLETKITLLDRIYNGPNGLYELQKQFLLDYRFFNSESQIKFLSREIKRYQNRFLFGYQGFKNITELNLILKSLNITSFEKLFYQYKLRKNII